jgi:hypothetical protein
MYFGISCATTALLAAIAVQAATADDFSVCAQATGDETIAACTRILVINPKLAHAYGTRGYAYIAKGD